MFLVMGFCLIPSVIKVLKTKFTAIINDNNSNDNNSNGEEIEELEMANSDENQIYNTLILVPASILHMLASMLQFISITLTYASSFQMFNGY